MSRSKREEPPAPSRPAEIPEPSTNGNGSSGAHEHEPAQEVLAGERERGEQTRRE
jgi:hypothetical protein